MYLKYSKVKDVKDPCRANVGIDAGIDLYIPEEFEKKTLKPNESILIPAGVKFEVPLGYAVILFNKSGVASKKCLLVGACVVDSGYAGEVHINLHNVGTKEVELNPGDKIVQAVMLPIITPTPMLVDEENLYKDVCSPSARGSGGFGSTGS